MRTNAETRRIDASVLVVAALGDVRSAPEQNSPPAPVRMRTRSDSVVFTSVRSSMSSSVIWASMAFFFSGRFMVTVTTPSPRSTFSVSNDPMVRP